MANFGATQRPHLTPPPPSHGQAAADTASPNGKQSKEFRFVCPFNIPSSQEAAALRIIKNLYHLGIHYFLFVWIVLFISLIPCRKVSLILLVIMTYVATVYLVLIKALPATNFLHKIIGREIVLPLIALVTAVELIFTEAGLHLLICLGATMPFVVVHAALWVWDGVSVMEEYGGAGEEVMPLVQQSGGRPDGGAADAAGSQSMV